MSQIVTDRLCPRCKTHHLKDYYASGDYNEDGVLQSYCPECGEMHPPIYINFTTFSLSQRKRRNTGTIVAVRYELPFDRMYDVMSGLSGIDDSDFVERFNKGVLNEFGIKLSREEIIKCLERVENK